MTFLIWLLCLRFPTALTSSYMARILFSAQATSRSVMTVVVTLFLGLVITACVPVTATTYRWASGTSQWDEQSNWLPSTDYPHLIGDVAIIDTSDGWVDQPDPAALDLRGVTLILIDGASLAPMLGSGFYFANCTVIDTPAAGPATSVMVASTGRPRCQSITLIGADARLQFGSEDPNPGMSDIEIGPVRGVGQVTFVTALTTSVEFRLYGGSSGDPIPVDSTVTLMFEPASAYLLSFPFDVAHSGTAIITGRSVASEFHWGVSPTNYPVDGARLKLRDVIFRTVSISSPACEFDGEVQMWPYVFFIYFIIRLHPGFLLLLLLLLLLLFCFLCPRSISDADHIILLMLWCGVVWCGVVCLGIVVCVSCVSTSTAQSVSCLTVSNPSISGSSLLIETMNNMGIVIGQIVGSPVTPVLATYTLNAGSGQISIGHLALANSHVEIGTLHIQSSGGGTLQLIAPSMKMSTLIINQANLSLLPSGSSQRIQITSSATVDLGCQFGGAAPFTKIEVLVGSDLRCTEGVLIGGSSLRANLSVGGQLTIGNGVMFGIMGPGSDLIIYSSTPGPSSWGTINGDIMLSSLTLINAGSPAPAPSKTVTVTGTAGVQLNGALVIQDVTLTVSGTGAGVFALNVRSLGTDSIIQVTDTYVISTTGVVLVCWLVTFESALLNPPTSGSSSGLIRVLWWYFVCCRILVVGWWLVGGGQYAQCDQRQ